MKPFCIITLGCKVNQCESAALGNLLEEDGWRGCLNGESPDAVIVNTCTVTSRAAMQSRQAIRQAVRRYPGAKIIVTGCYAQTAAEEIGTIEGVDLIVGHDDKMRIAGLAADPADPASRSPVHLRSDPSGTFTALPAVDRRERTRAFLKIQDGCNTRCTYCIVPYARGRSRSMPVRDVQTHLRRLGADGIREVVLTGIHLGAYGLDLHPPADLAGLVADLTAAPPVDRMRLSSIEPTEVSPRLVEMMQDPRGVLCRHFHIPLQSGDDTILRRMGRPYRQEAFARTVTDIQRRIPDAAIGLDVMAGFPGETEEAFQNTYRLIEDLPVTYLHVFPFSPRKGTPAAAFKQKVPQRVAKERCRRLRALGEKKKAAFYRNMAGRTLTVLIETSANGKTECPAGLSDNYIAVTLPGARVRENTLVRVRVEGVAADGTATGRLA